MSAHDIDEIAVKTGFMFKRGGGKVSDGWKKRYFVLSGNALYYYKSDKVFLIILILILLILIVIYYILELESRNSDLDSIYNRTAIAIQSFGYLYINELSINNISIHPAINFIYSITFLLPFPFLLPISTYYLFLFPIGEETPRSRRPSPRLSNRRGNGRYQTEEVLLSNRTS